MAKKLIQQIRGLFGGPNATGSTHLLDLPRGIKLVLYTIRGVNRHQTMVRSAALSFYTIMSLVPILALVFAVFKGFGLDLGFMSEMYNRFPEYNQLLDMLFGFADGRICKVPLSSYVTKTNRKMLTKAYSDHSPLVSSVYIEEDRDLVAFGSNEKALVFNTSMIPEKVTRSSQGVKTFNPGKRGKMINLTLFEDSGIAEAKPYKSRNLPAAGAKLIAEDKDGEQLSLI